MKTKTGAISHLAILPFMLMPAASLAGPRTLSPISSAQNHEKSSPEAQKTTTRSITEDEGKAIALKLVPGKFLEIEQKKHKDEPVYAVEIRAEDGVHEIIVRIADGIVVENKISDDEDEDEDEDESYDE